MTDAILKHFIFPLSACDLNPDMLSHHFSDCTAQRKWIWLSNQSQENTLVICSFQCYAPFSGVTAMSETPLTHAPPIEDQQIQRRATKACATLPHTGRNQVRWRRKSLSATVVPKLAWSNILNSKDFQRKKQHFACSMPRLLA